MRPTIDGPPGVSATHGSDACTSKKMAPVRRTARSTSDNASIGKPREQSPQHARSGRSATSGGRPVIGAAGRPRYTRTRDEERFDSTRRLIMNGTETTTSTNPELDAIKARQNATWSSGDFGIIGTTLQIVGESLCEAVDLRAGSTVLDVAAGNGNCSLAAARRFCDVTSTDYV